MPDMKFPRYIFSIGGAGKELIYSMLGNPVEKDVGKEKVYVTTGKDWIIRELVRPKPNPVTVDITIVDTALEDENDDIGKIRAINDLIDKISTEYSSSLADNSNLSLGRIRIDYELLTSKMTLTTPSSLVGIGDDIKKANLAKVWWINDPQLGEDWLDKVMSQENLRQQNFSKGVYRKRSVAKAIYYKAISSNLFNPNILENEQVDIIIGLGGGTGSGIAIDLAKRLKGIQPMANITLFGILSTINETRDEKANNFAILTELEYGIVNTDKDMLKNIFKNIILIPIEKTEYGGKRHTKYEYQKLLAEFDKTFAHIFVSYHNTGKGEELFSDLPEFAPFVIATSQLVQYNIDAIKKFEEDLLKVLEDRKRSFAEEETIYGIKSLIDEWYTDITKATLSEKDEELVRDRLSKFEKVLGHKTFTDLKYESVMQLKNAVSAGNIISNMEAPNESSVRTKSDIDIYVNSIISQIPNYPIGGGKDDIDPILYNIMKKDIEMIGKMILVLKSTNKVDDSTIKFALKSVIKGDQLEMGVGQRELMKKINEFSNEEKELEKKVQEWKQINAVDIDFLNSMDNLNNELSKNIIYIKNELNEYANKLNSMNRTKDVNTIENLEIGKVLEKMYQDILNTMNIEFKDKSSIVESLTFLKELKRNQIENKKGIKLIHKLTGRARSMRQKIKIEIDRLTSEIDKRKIFKIKEDETFLSIYTPDIEEKINENKDKKIDSIIKNTKEVFPNATPIMLSNLKDKLKDYNSNLKDKLKDYNSRKEVNINEIMTNVSGKLRLHRAFDDKLTAIKSALAKYSMYVGNYYNFIDNMEDSVEKLRKEKRDSIYVTEAQPKNLLQIMAKKSDINKMIKTAQEMTNLKTYLEDGLERTLDNNYNVLSSLKIESLRGTKTWNRTRTMNAFVTIADIGSNIVNAERKIRNAFNPGGYADWVCPWGDPWEVGLVLFIAGIPLDNIKNVVNAKDGFYAKYKEAEPNIFFYHSLMLEEGNLVKRKKIFNLDIEEEKALLLQEKEDVKALYAENHEIVPIKECL